MRILTLTTLYPNAANPTHGVFVENRLREVCRSGDVELKVVAPVPWFPFRSELFGNYARFAKAPHRETRHGLDIRHPRYFLPPKVGMTFAAKSLTRCFLREARKLIAEGWEFDLIDAHYFYPDGVAAVNVGEALDKPVIVTARGTDINLIPDYPKQREMILGAAAGARHSITVCQALKDEMVRLGAAEEKITVLRNGVDLDLFRPMDRETIRSSLGVSGTVLLSAGHLIERKGHDLVLRLLTDFPEATLLIAGDGPEEQALKALAASLGVFPRVKFLGRLPHDELPRIYNAADILVLASSREGWPNVLLEAMACGTPAVASPVWGSGEVITAAAAGRLATERSVDALSSAVAGLLAELPDRRETRAYAEQFSWDETADGVKRVWQNVLAAPGASHWQARQPLAFPAEKPALLVTVDTEEIFDWDRDAFDHHTLADPADIARFQALCEQHHCKPLYFITWPLMQDPATAAFFRQLHEDGKADLGLHLHQWVTPPHDQENTAYTSYQCNLPPELHAAKLKELVNTFQDTFGFAPVSHRAGRYGVSPSVHQDLAAAGVFYDFSPNAGGDQSGTGGPDFSDVTSRGWIRYAAPNEQPLVCLPVSGGRTWRRTNFLLPQPGSRTGRFATLPAWQKNLTALRRLSPEGFSINDMTGFAEALLRQDIRLMTFSLHSTSLTTGATPYSRTAADVETLLERTDQFFTWFQKEKGGRFAALSDIVNASRPSVSQ